jgi:AcrR family transcriptional regulator
MSNPKRPRRGNPDETRARIVAAAAEVFNRDGFYGTDSNRIAHAAGYAAGTFYKHFAGKEEVFIAAYESWVTDEWRAIAELVGRDASSERSARDIVATVLELHRRWHGFRASLRALAVSDPAVRRAWRAQRERQLELMVELRATHGGAPRTREEDAMLLMTMERVCDAVADGEARELGLVEERVIAQLRKKIVAHFEK